MLPGVLDCLVLVFGEKNGSEMWLPGPRVLPTVAPKVVMVCCVVVLQPGGVPLVAQWLSLPAITSS